MENVSLVEILPKAKKPGERARNRIHEHGKVMKLLRTKSDAFLVESVGKTWNGTFWMGWFRSEEADYLEVA